MSEEIKLSILFSGNPHLYDLYESGYMLIHMLEISNHQIYDRDKKPDLKSFIPYADDNGSMKILPCSSVREGFSMELFTSENNVGLVLDAREINLIYTAPNLIYNNALENKLEKVSVMELSRFPETDALQELERNGFYETRIPGEGPLTVIPMDVSPEKNARCLKALDLSWQLIKKDTAKNNDRYGYFSSLMDHIDFSKITETLVSVDDIKRVKSVVYTSKQMPEYSFSTQEERHSSPLHALALKGFLKKNFNMDVPVINYHTGIGSPIITEMQFEKDKVEEALERYANIMPASMRENIPYAFEPLVAAEADSNIRRSGPVAPAMVPKSLGDFRS